jgi:hypothetical protein
MREESANILNEIRDRSVEYADLVHRELGVPDSKINGLVRIPKSIEKKSGKKAPKYMIYKERDFMAVVERIDALSGRVLEFSQKCCGLRAPKRKRST